MDEQVKYPWPAAAILALLIVAAYLFIATSTTLFDRDEPRFSQATVEMVRSGNYLFPTFDGKLRPDKPIMIYWIMSLGVRLLGPTEAGVRLQSVLAAGGTLLLIFWMGRRLWNTRTGLVAMAILATTPLMAGMSTLATADAVLLFFLTCAMAIYVDAVMRGKMGWTHIAMLGLMIGAATLTKGPVGLAVPLLGMLTTWSLLKRPWRRGTASPDSENPIALPGMTGAWIAAAIGIVLFLAWGVPANNATNGLFLKLGLGHHVMDRVVRPLEHHGGNWFLSLPYYVPVLAVAFFPWTLFLLGSGSAVWNNRLGGPKQRALLLGFTIPTFVLMSVVSTKLPHYILPTWPALALAVAATLAAERRGELSATDRKWLHRGAALFVPGIVTALIATILLWVMQSHIPHHGSGIALALPLVRWPGTILAAVVVIAGSVVFRLHQMYRFQAAAVVLFAGACASGLTAAALVLPALEPLKPSPALAQIIRKQSGENVPITECGFGEPTLNFYSGRTTDMIGPTAVVNWSKMEGPGVLVITKPDLETAKTGGPLVGLVEMGQVRGLSNAQARPLDLVVLGRHLDAAKATSTEPGSVTPDRPSSAGSALR